MRFFVKAVASGFGLSLGTALFKKVSKKLGLDDDEKKTSEDSEEVSKAEAQSEDT